MAQYIKEIGRPFNKVLIQWALNTGSAKTFRDEVDQTINEIMNETAQVIEGLADDNPLKVYAMRKIREIQEEDNNLSEVRKIFRKHYRDHKITSSNLSSKESKRVLELVGSIYGHARGKFLEILAYFKFNGIVKSDVSVAELISKEAAKKALKYGMLSSELDKAKTYEIDFLMEDGSWVEIKNYRTQFNSFHPLYEQIIKKAKLLQVLSRHEGMFRGKEVPVIFAFLGGGISEETRKELFLIGVRVMTDQDLEQNLSIH